jgi:hypothetical protein
MQVFGAPPKIREGQVRTIYVEEEAEASPFFARMTENSSTNQEQTGPSAVARPPVVHSLLIVGGLQWPQRNRKLWCCVAFPSWATARLPGCAAVSMRPTSRCRWSHSRCDTRRRVAGRIVPNPRSSRSAALPTPRIALRCGPVGPGALLVSSAVEAPRGSRGGPSCWDGPSSWEQRRPLRARGSPGVYYPLQPRTMRPPA